MEIITAKKYSLHDFYSIMNMNISFDLPDNLNNILKEIDNEIVPIVVERNSTEKHHKSKTDHRSKRPTQQKKEELAWENIRSFKTTKIEKKEGKEKILNDIRICLNKMSTKNYNNQKVTIIQCLNDLKEFFANDDNNDTPKNNFQKIAENIFDIASTNSFYAETYAKLYKELMEYDIVFNDILNTFLMNYANCIKDLQFVNPEDDYEKYCTYNKKNDQRRATAVFIVCLMKENIIPVLKVMSIMVSFQELAVEYVENENRTNDMEEIAMTLFLFLEKGIDVFSNCKAEWIWKFVITKHIQTFAKYKKTDKKGLSSRTIFKYMDMVQLIES